MADGRPQTATLQQSSLLVGQVLRCDSELVAVHLGETGRRLIAAHSIGIGTHLFTITGRESLVPTRYSLQVGAQLHLDQDCARDEHDLIKRYYWRYLDHSCEPTTMIRNREVIALRDIAGGEGVTFDYNTTEYEMASPFQCYCGSERCVGTIRGAKHLTPAQRKRVVRRMAEYLR